MTLARWNPAKSVFTLKSDMDRLFDSFFGGAEGAAESFSDLSIPVDVKETSHEFIVAAEIPGIAKDDISISFENNYLRISGEKKAQKEKKEENYHQIERHYGRFSRTVPIPAGVMLDKIEAAYDHGILTVTIPKTEEAKPKQIEVKIK